MRTIQLDKVSLEDFIYQFTSSELLEDGEGLSEDLLKLYTKASDAARLKYKKTYDEEPEMPFDAEFAGFTAAYLIPLLQNAYDAFHIEEKTAEGSGRVVSASFCATKNGDRFVLIDDVNDIIDY